MGPVVYITVNHTRMSLSETTNYNANAIRSRVETDNISVQVQYVNDVNSISYNYMPLVKNLKAICATRA